MSSGYPGAWIIRWPPPFDAFIQYGTRSLRVAQSRQMSTPSSDDVTLPVSLCLFNSSPCSLPRRSRRNARLKFVFSGRSRNGHYALAKYSPSSNEPDAHVRCHRRAQGPKQSPSPLNTSIWTGRRGFDDCVKTGSSYPPSHTFAHCTVSVDK